MTRPRKPIPKTAFDISQEQVNHYITNEGQPVNETRSNRNRGTDYSFKNDAQFIDVAGDYDNKEWSRFGIDNYWKLEYTDRKNVDQELNSNKDRAVWFVEKLYGTQPV
jgi:hypothetical protein